MDALFEHLKDQPLALLAFGAVVAVIFGVRYLGLWQGQKASPAASAGAAQVAAVIVDPTALQHATAALEAFNITLMETNRVGRELIESNELAAKGLDRIREEMRLDREIGRRQT